jgi:hypothetical protein
MDTLRIFVVEVAQVARISEPVETLPGAQPSEAREEAVELFTATVGTAERWRTVNIQDEQAMRPAAVATCVFVNWHGVPHLSDALDSSNSPGTVKPHGGSLST